LVQDIISIEGLSIRLRGGIGLTGVGNISFEINARELLFIQVINIIG